MESIDFCLKDLSITLNIRKEKLENELGLSPPRTVKYFHIDKMLEDYGVHQSDREIILDAHDFACNDSPIDFVTFDHDCYEGAKNVELLCFNSVRGKNDFN